MERNEALCLMDMSDKCYDRYRIFIHKFYDDLPENMSPYQASLEYAKIWGRLAENPEVTDRGRIGNCDHCAFMVYSDMGMHCKVLSFPDGMPEGFYCGFYKEQL